MRWALPFYVLFVLYILDLHWTDMDVQAFVALQQSYVPEHSDVQTFTDLLRDTPYGGKLIPPAVGLMLLGVGFLLALRGPRALMGQLPSAVLAVAMFALASITWSVAPASGFGPGTSIILVLLYSALSIEMFGIETTLRTLWWTSLFVLMAGVGLGVTGNPHGLNSDVNGNAWRGLFMHKQALGSCAASFLILTLFFRRTLAINRPMLFGAIFLAVIAGLGSQSKSALVVLAAAVCIFASQIALRRYRIVIYFYALLVCAVVVVVLALSDASAPGSGVSLTGRTDIWGGALPISFEKPFGFGLGTMGGDRALEAMVESSGWHEVRSAHSSYIQMALDFGWPAAIVFIIWLFRQAFRIVQPEPEHVGVGVLAIAHIIVGSVETSLGGIYGSYSLILLLTTAIGFPLRFGREECVSSPEADELLDGSSPHLAK